MEAKNEKLPEMSFWGHVDALRGVLLRIAAIVIVMMGIFFYFMPALFDTVILAPCRGDFPLYELFHWITTKWDILPDFETDNFHVNLINIQLASQFFIHMSTSFWLAIVFSFPIIIYLLWHFISPALYSKEKTGIRSAFILGNLMFFIGVGVGYFLVFPMTLRFLAEYQVSAMVPNQISLDSYMDNFLIMIFIMGVIFELPLIAWALSAMGLITRRFFKKYRRHAIITLLLLAAIITPTGDPFTLTIVFLPLYILFELSAFFVKPYVPSEDDEENNDEDDNDDGLEYIPKYKNKD